MKRKSIYIVVAVIMFVVILGCLSFFGVIYIGTKTPNQQVIVANRNYACGEDIVTEYKEISQKEQSMTASAFDAIADRIQSIKDYDKDIVCVYVLLVRAYLNDDKDSANTLAGYIKNSSSGTSIQNIQGIMDLNITNTSIDILTKGVRYTSGDVKDKG